MLIRCIGNTLSETTCDAVILAGPFEGLSGTMVDLDRSQKELVTRLLESKEFEGKLGETLVVHQPTGFATPMLVLVGLGSRENFSCGNAFRAAASASRACSSKTRPHIAFHVDAAWSPRLQTHALAGLIVGCHGGDLYRRQKSRFPFETIDCARFDSTSLKSGEILGQAVNLARTLVNEPANELYPESFVQRIESLPRQANVTLEIWDESRLKEERCGALLAVAQGSVRSPRLLMMRYQGDDSVDAHWLGLVGKGVTFDSGGLSLKPNDGMKTMKCDMGGAATVVATVDAVSRMALPVNVIGLVGLVENMPSDNALKLGDVLTARNGKTIEVLNTDAEGRLVLADVLSVAVDQGVDRIIDLATLTGACVVALGLDVSGLMTNDQEWCDSISLAARDCGEPAWQLPLFAEYAEQIRSDIADIKNVGNGRWGGAITAAKFLEEFVSNVPWTHIDIAGPAFLDKPNAMLDAGGTGVMVRSLVELISSQA